MRILCLGLPRSGTDSLRTALSVLGYEEILHGFTIAASRAGDCAVWCRLLEAKLLTIDQGELRGQSKGDSESAIREIEFLKTFNWDSLLGDCDVVMDIPAAIFWRELLDFYPEAKVIVNKRGNMDRWHQSLTGAERDFSKVPRDGCSGP